MGIKGQGGFNKARVSGSARDGDEGCLMLGWGMRVKGECERLGEGLQRRYGLARFTGSA